MVTIRSTNFPQPNSALNYRVLSSLLPPSPPLWSPLYLSIFSTLLPLNRVSTPVVWTVVDTVGAHPLVETLRARNGTGKGKTDALLAALYVSCLSMVINELTWLLSVSYSPATCSTYICSSYHWRSLHRRYRNISPPAYHVRCTWSVNNRSGVGLLTVHVDYRLGKTSPVLFCLAGLDLV